MNLTRRLLGTALASFLLMGTGALAHGTYPEKPVKIVVGFPAGGGADTIARLLATRLADSLGQPVLVENKPGADGLIAGETVAKAKTDGYTLLLVSGSHTINPALGRKMPYDTLKDFAPICLVAEQQLLLVSRAAFPAPDLPQLIRHLKANPGKATFASSSTGTLLPIELFKLQSGTSFVDVPYKGTAPVLTDLLAGHVDLSIMGAATAIQHVQSGKLRALGVGGSKRSPSFPDIPTIAEAGVPGFEASAWTGVFAPAGTPQAVIDRLAREFIAVSRMPEFQASLKALGADVIAAGPDGLAKFVTADLQKWTQVVKQSNLKLE